MSSDSVSTQQETTPNKPNEDTQNRIGDIIALYGHESDKWPMILDNSFFSDKFTQMNYVCVGLDTEPYSDMYINSKIIAKTKFINLTGSDDENRNTDKLHTLVNCFKTYSDYSGSDEFIKHANGLFIDWDDTEIIALPRDSNRNNFYGFVKSLDSLEILKVNSPTNVYWVINTVIECGFLPTVIYAKFPTCEDYEILTNSFIGHLRNMGYNLFCNHEGKYLFFYGNEFAYEYVDCKEVKTKNPLIEHIIMTSINSYKSFLENPKGKLAIRFRPRVHKKSLETVAETTAEAETKSETKSEA